jgi:glutaredoxin
MKPLIVLFAICTLGYVVDHWKELTERHSLVATSDAHGLIIYSSKTCPACIVLEADLKKRGIAYRKCDLADQANVREMTDKLARIGKMGGSIPMPVADIDGIMVEGASIKDIIRRMH